MKTLVFIMLALLCAPIAAQTAQPAPKHYPLVWHLKNGALPPAGEATYPQTLPAVMPLTLVQSDQFAGWGWWWFDAQSQSWRRYVETVDLQQLRALKIDTVPMFSDPSCHYQKDPYDFPWGAAAAFTRCMYSLPDAQARESARAKLKTLAPPITQCSDAMTAGDHKTFCTRLIAGLAALMPAAAPAQPPKTDPPPVPVPSSTWIVSKFGLSAAATARPVYETKLDALTGKPILTAKKLTDAPVGAPCDCILQSIPRTDAPRPYCAWPASGKDSAVICEKKP